MILRHYKYEITSVIVFFSIISIHTAAATTKPVSVGIDTRVELLKMEILKEIEKEGQDASLGSDNYADIYDYIAENRPITPIMEDDERKVKNKFKLPKLKITTSNWIPPETSEKDDALRQKNAKKSRIKLRKPKEVFYRKMFDYDEKNEPQKLRVSTPTGPKASLKKTLDKQNGKGLGIFVVV